MFCCVRSRDRKEGKSADQHNTALHGQTLPPPPPAGQYGYDKKIGKYGGLNDGNMVVLAGAGAVVAATAVTAAVVVSDRNTGGDGGVADVGDTGGGGCWCGGGCGGCGGD
ncbi:hypothetical protein ABFX02_13G055900 [Erythranthe guttata]